MSELQATIELSVEFQKFYNVDLFQRGYYQVRSQIKTSSKVPTKVEVSLPRNQPSNMAYPACIINGAAVTKTFQILYRNEEVRLEDVINFRIHTIVEAGKIQETLEKLELQITLELWYTEEGIGLTNGGLHHSSSTTSASSSTTNTSTSGHHHANVSNTNQHHIECVSSRILNIHLNPKRGLHYHLPVLFDYFHLSAVSLTIHAVLVALHQPYINSPRLNGTGNGKTSRHRLGSAKNQTHKNASLQTNQQQKPQSMDALFFGNSKNKDRMCNARKIHSEVCGLLLSSLESLQQAHNEFVDLLPPTNIALDLMDNMKIQVTDCHKRLYQMSEMAKVKKSEDDFLEMACSDISQLCGEVVVLWNNFVNYFTGRAEISQHLARVHHHQRIKRFSEAFFLVDHPRKSALDCVESMYTRYASLSESLRTSAYLMSLPPLPVSCTELDGEATTMPIIFEDVYKDEEQVNDEFRKRRHSFSDVKPSDISASNEDIITALEALSGSSSSSKNRKSPRPTSVPFNKSFLSDTTAKDLMASSMTAAVTTTGSSLENPLSSLSSGYFSDSPIPGNFKKSLVTDQEIVQIPLEQEHDDEPNILAAKPFVAAASSQPQKSSLTAQQNLSSNGSLIEGQGYSHLEWSASIPFNVAEEPDDVQGMTHSHSCQSMPLSSQETTNEQKSSLEENGSSSRSSSMKSDHSNAFPPTAAANETTVVTSNITNQDQEALSKQLEFVRQKSRSTFLDRPRARSEELMVVKQKFPHQMPDAQKTSGKCNDDNTDAMVLRQRMQSDSCLETILADEATEIATEKTRRKTTSALTSPHLIQAILAPGSKPNENNKLKILPPKPFRDPSPRNNAETELKRHSMSEFKVPNNSNISNAKKHGKSLCSDMSEMKIDPASSVPMRRKAKESGHQNGHGGPLQHSTFSLSRIDSKRNSKNQDFFVMATTGDMMENKPILNKTETSSRGGREMSCDLYSGLTSVESRTLERLNTLVGEETVAFVKAKEKFKKSKESPGILYSDIRPNYSVPYFHFAEDNLLMWQQQSRLLANRQERRRHQQPNGTSNHHQLHLVICVHGLDGNSADLRLIKTYLEMALPGHNLDFLMSEENQGETFSDLESMTDRLIDEILQHISNYSQPPTRLSFVGHSLGTILIRSAICRSRMAHLVPFFHTFLSLSGPHLGTLYNNSGLVNMGMWFMQKWKKSGSLHQLALKDATDIRQTFMYQLSQKSNLHMFRHVLLAGSTQDRYVPWHSARIELCKAAVKDHSVTGSAYKEMVHNIISPIVSRGAEHCTLARFDIHHALPSNTNALIGRAAHIAVLDSELFIEKFLVISILKYFQ